MFNGHTSPLIVNNHQVWVHLGGFTIERERPFLPYNFIDEGIHEDTPHTVFVLVAQQSGDDGRVKRFSGFPYQFQP